jgi:hypothetical protein
MKTFHPGNTLYIGINDLPMKFTALEQQILMKIKSIRKMTIPARSIFLSINYAIFTGIIW